MRRDRRVDVRYHVKRLHDLLNQLEVWTHARVDQHENNADQHNNYKVFHDRTTGTPLAALVIPTSVRLILGSTSRLGVTSTPARL